eukprot:1595295-Karenia_brevis.AAC.1
MRKSTRSVCALSNSQSVGIDSEHGTGTGEEYWLRLRQGTMNKKLSKANMCKSSVSSVELNLVLIKYISLCKFVTQPNMSLDKRGS